MYIYATLITIFIVRGSLQKNTAVLISRTIPKTLNADLRFRRKKISKNKLKRIRKSFFKRLFETRYFYESPMFPFRASNTIDYPLAQQAHIEFAERTTNINKQNKIKITKKGPNSFIEYSLPLAENPDMETAFVRTKGERHERKARTDSSVNGRLRDAFLHFSTQTPFFPREQNTIQSPVYPSLSVAAQMDRISRLFDKEGRPDVGPRRSAAQRTRSLFIHFSE